MFGVFIFVPVDHLHDEWLEQIASKIVNITGELKQSRIEIVIDFGEPVKVGAA